MGSIELRHLGILVFVLGIMTLGCSVRYVHSIQGEMHRSLSIAHRLWMGYRVRIVRWMFWTGLILIALGSAMQW